MTAHPIYGCARVVNMLVEGQSAFFGTMKLGSKLLTAQTFADLSSKPQPCMSYGWRYARQQRFCWTLHLMAIARQLPRN